MMKGKAAGCAAITVALVAGCGGGGGEGPKVASVPGASTAAAAPAARDQATDRQLPLGATRQQIDRAYAAYYACWTAHGVPSTKRNGVDGGPLLSYKLDQKRYQPAVDACADLEPLNPPELDPQQNPDYWDDLRDEATCVRAKGLPLAVVPGREGLWVQPETDANFRKVRTDEAVRILRDCEVRSYTKTK